MAASLVESGDLDVEIAVPLRKELAGSPPYDFGELLGFLRGSHSVDYVYRGQTRIWPGPLLPSMYRGAVAQDAVTNVPQQYRLRGEGNAFYAVNEDAIRKKPADFLKRVEFNRHLYHIFGYPFGSVLAQQCGLTSEALDVSHDPDVASFFAVFDYASGAFPDQGTGVIYRLAVSEDQTGNKDFRTASFYDSPSVISALAAFGGLRRCSTWKEAVDSFLEYGYRLTTGQFEDKLAVRPLQLLGLPHEDLAACRVVQQRAALLLPDVVLPRDHRILNRKPPPGKAEWDGELLVEDLAIRKGIEPFQFRHSPRNKYLVPLSPEVLFPKNDGLTRMLKAFLVANPRFLFVTELGVAGNPDLDLIE